MRAQDKLEAVRGKIKSKFSTVQVGVYPVDIQNHADVDNAVQKAISELGQIDILINNVRSLSSPPKHPSLSSKPGLFLTCHRLVLPLGPLEGFGKFLST